MATVALRVASSEEIESHRVDRVDRDGRADARRRWARPGLLVALVPAAAMLGLGLVGLDRHSLWRDEAATLVGARRSLPDLWLMLGHVETVHALYYGFMHAWLQLGSGVVWARVPSVLAMAVAAGLVGALGARLASTRVGLVAGLLFVVSPAASYFAQEARSTAFVAVLALACTWFLLQALERRRGWWWAYAAAGAVLAGLNVLAVLVLLALGLTLLWWRRPRGDLGRWALATAPAVVVGGFIMAVSGEQPYQLGWIPRPGIGSLREFAHLVLGPDRALLVAMLVLVVAALLPFRSAPGRRLRALAVPLLVLPVTILVLASLVQPVFVARYVFPSVAGAALLAALGVERLVQVVPARAARRLGTRAPAVAAALVVLVVAVLGLGAQRLERTPDSRPDDLTGAAAVVARGGRPGDAVLFLPDNRRLVALVYPRAFAGLDDVALGGSPEATRNLTGRRLPLATTLEHLGTSTRVWVVGRPDLQLEDSEADAKVELALLDRDFAVAERGGSHGFGVTLYVRRPVRS